MAGPLADIYSYLDTQKRKLSGLLADPRGSLDQFVGNLGDQTNQSNALMQAAGYGLLNRPFTSVLADNRPSIGSWNPQAVTPQQNALARALLADQGSQQGIAGTVAPKIADMSYQIQHKPMTIEGGAAPLHDLTQSFGDDIFSKNALQYYGSGDPREAAILRTMKSVAGKPDAKVTIYRGVPDGVNAINSGDWVSLHPDVASDYGKVLSQQVPASHITAWPDSLMEFGYYPPK